MPLVFPSDLDPADLVDLEREHRTANAPTDEQHAEAMAAIAPLTDRPTWPAPAPLGNCVNCGLPVAWETFGFLVHAQDWMIGVGPMTCAVASGDPDRRGIAEVA